MANATHGVSDSDDVRLRELDALLEQAANAPGIAEVMVLAKQHQALLEQANAYLGTRDRIVSVGTTDSTGW